MNHTHERPGRRSTAYGPALALGMLLVLGLAPAGLRVQAQETGKIDGALERWLGPQQWQRDSDQPVLSLGRKGDFDDQHIFAPHVIRQGDEYWMYYSGSQRCVDAGTYKGVPKDPAHPETSDQRLFKLGLATSKDGVHFTRYSRDPVFSFGDDIHSVVTAAILKNPDGSVHREDGKLRMYFAAVDFPHGTYKHDLYETTSADGWSFTQRICMSCSMAVTGATTSAQRSVSP